ncbi:uncharacterized protein LOC106706487 isoform X2 [Latimeria chalumnae]|uniref:uncharacterized protein LOC106706487 isoform X2 n=1 Tax=Latimeria chalumnae TaxID=7897 RepID=UPI0006D8EE6F|nr:PREDICTED: uncharacterized protein LOC106706487 isoform X2 [Latimeria chalumnae]|eukprot:XP_014353019.1 PREDICTED: uncharacterized protein LOC106706487 isoform X2 [Latimeria chalumnae]
MNGAPPYQWGYQDPNCNIQPPPYGPYQSPSQPSYHQVTEVHTRYQNYAPTNQMPSYGGMATASGTYPVNMSGMQANPMPYQYSPQVIHHFPSAPSMPTVMSSPGGPTVVSSFPTVPSQPIVMTSSSAMASLQPTHVTVGGAPMIMAIIGQGKSTTVTGLAKDVMCSIIESAFMPKSKKKGAVAVVVPGNGFIIQK